MRAFKIFIAVALTWLSAACAPIPAPKPPTPPVVANYVIGIVVQAADDQEPLVGIPVHLHYLDGYHTQATTGTGLTIFSVPPSLVDSDIIIDAPGYLEFTAHIDVVNQKNYFFSLKDAFPQPPSRDEVLSSHETFQGLQVTLPDLGETVWWFDPAISSLDATDRQAVYAAKHAAGDTALGLAVSWNYTGDGNFSYPVPGDDLTDDYPRFVGLVQEAIQNGFTPWIFMAGDGESAPGCGYNQHNDPVGWTYGYTCLTTHILPQLVAALQANTPNLLPYVILFPGYDGVIPAWQPPSQVDAYLTQARALVGNYYLGIEPSVGYTGWGGGIEPDQNYFTPTGQMVDKILSEFNNWPSMDSAEWQIIARFVGPAFVRPAAETDDPAPPFILKNGTPRGAFYYDCFEYAEYKAVRDQLAAADFAAARAAYKALGCPRVD